MIYSSWGHHYLGTVTPKVPLQGFIKTSGVLGLKEVETQQGQSGCDPAQGLSGSP